MQHTVYIADIILIVGLFWHKLKQPKPKWSFCSSLKENENLKRIQGECEQAIVIFFFSFKKVRVGFKYLNACAIHVSMVHGIVKCQMTMPMGCRML